MAEYAIGWLGWTEEQALAADVNAIAVGVAGKAAMLKAIFGGEDSQPTPPKATPVASRPMTPDLFDALF